VRRAGRWLLLACAAWGFGVAGAQETPPPPSPPPSEDASRVVNAILGGLGGFGNTTSEELQREIAEVGGVPFRSAVPLDFMTHAELVRYVRKLVEDEYPVEEADADRRLLAAFGLLAPETDLRSVRGRLLEDNVAGFYDERPGRRRLYAVSADRQLTPSNQIVLAHELRHALQDQYTEVHTMLPDSVGDFDDRRIAYLSLLEGDATLVMERFLLRRVAGPAGEGIDLSGLSLPAAPDIPGAPPVLRDQLVQPYFIGREFAKAVFERGGWAALREAWSRPPRSTEQVLHPGKFFAGEEPRGVDLPAGPGGARLLDEGVLGELLARTLAGEGSERAASGWGGDGFRVWDVAGRTLLVFRSVWDTKDDAREFLEAVRGAFQARHGVPTTQQGFSVYAAKPWSFAWGEHEDGVILVSSDDPAALAAALGRLAGPARAGS
jgi:hypothetical protein